MGILTVQQWGAASTAAGSGGGGGAAMVLGVMVIAVLVVAAALMYRDWRQLHESVADRLGREAQRWLRHQPRR